MFDQIDRDVHNSAQRRILCTQKSPSHETKSLLTRKRMPCKQAPQYNGKRGTIERWEGDRFVVKLEGKDKGVKIKPDNLRAVTARNKHTDNDRGADLEEEEEEGPAAFSGIVHER